MSIYMGLWWVLDQSWCAIIWQLRMKMPIMLQGKRDLYYRTTKITSMKMMIVRLFRALVPSSSKSIMNTLKINNTLLYGDATNWVNYL